MGIRTAILILSVLAGVQTFACEPARVQFEGTAFARSAMQIEADKIYFFRGTKQELSIAYSPRQKKWCYSDDQADVAHPASGCMDRKIADGKRLFLINGKPAKTFVVLGLNKKPVATVNVIGKVMTANFLGGNGKPLGKRIVFKSVTKDYFESLEVRGWNCPNPRFLSCVGSDLTSVLESEAEAETASARLKVADLAKKLGHYRFSCAGIVEHAVDGSGDTKRAPSLTEPK
ncbi:MAG: hypothetical protein ACXVA9_06020 [Bdellovibrionales bacterium]